MVRGWVVAIGVEVAHGRAADGGAGQPAGAEPRVYIRQIVVEARDSAGWDLEATLVGSPTNLGTEAAPVHSRIVKLTRRRSSACGTAMNEMSLRVTPTDVTVL